MKKFRNLPYNPNLLQRAKELRKAGVLSEVLLWNQLKNRKFKNLDFDIQKVIGNYIVDFFCATYIVVIEVDGVSHDFKYDYDMQRDTFLKELGLNIIHIPDSDVKRDINAVINYLKEHEYFRGE